MKLTILEAEPSPYFVSFILTSRSKIKIMYLDPETSSGWQFQRKPRRRASRNSFRLRDGVGPKKKKWLLNLILNGVLWMMMYRDSSQLRCYLRNKIYFVLGNALNDRWRDSSSLVPCSVWMTSKEIFHSFAATFVTKYILFSAMFRMAIIIALVLDTKLWFPYNSNQNFTRTDENIVISNVTSSISTEEKCIEKSYL